MKLKTKKNNDKAKYSKKQKKTEKKIILARARKISFNYIDDTMKLYKPIFTIIEPLDKSKRVLDFTLMRMKLKGYGLNECNQFDCMKNKIMFVWLNYDENSVHWLKRKYYNTSIYLQNSLTNMESISSKEQLHLGMEKHFPDIYKTHIAHSHILTKLWKPDFANSDVYIARPINVLDEKREKGEVGIGYGGKDIIIIHNQKTLNQAKDLLKKYDNVLISDYITNPLLFRGHKFHIRTFLLASIINGIFSTYMLDFGRIFISKIPYVQSDWDNPNIHDTHMKSTPKDWFFPKDFTNANINRDDITFDTVYKIFKQIRKIFISVSELLSKTVGLYDNVKNGFIIFGVDLMIRDDLTVVLIECNDEGTYKSKEPETHKKLENILFNWVDDVIFEPLFTYSKTTKHKHQTLFTKKLNL
jgi:hypothetical protein